MRYRLGLTILLILGCNAGETPTPPANSSPSDKVPRIVGPLQERIPDTSKQETKAGIGAALRVDKGDVFIGKVLPETPAAWSNAVQENDRIIAVAEGDDEPVNVTGLKLTKVVSLIRGSKGTVVRLTIVPAGKSETDLQVVSLTRGEIEALNRFGDGKLIPVGSKAPNFRFTRLVDEEDAELSQHAGKILVLEFWPGQLPRRGP